MSLIARLFDLKYKLESPYLKHSQLHGKSHEISVTSINSNFHSRKYNTTLNRLFSIKSV